MKVLFKDLIYNLVAGAFFFSFCTASLVVCDFTSSPYHNGVSNAPVCAAKCMLGLGLCFALELKLRNENKRNDKTV